MHRWILLVYLAPDYNIIPDIISLHSIVNLFMFIHSIFIKHLQYVKSCSSHWGYSNACNVYSYIQCKFESLLGTRHYICCEMLCARDSCSWFLRTHNIQSSEEWLKAVTESKREALPFATIWMNQRDTVLSDNRERQILHNLTFT